MKKKILYVLIVLCITSESKGWDSAAAKYYPVTIGNTYIYKKVYYEFFCVINTKTEYLRVEINGDTLMPNGKKYFRFEGYDYFSTWNYQRIDSNSMNVYGYLNGNEILLDSLLGRKGNFFSGKRNLNAVLALVDDEITFFLFNSFWDAKIILNNSLELFYSYYLLENIGLSYMVVCTEDSGYILETLGCVINGVAYGDTTLTAINQVNSFVSDNFSLSQNYPNPFNPETVISYSLIENRFVTLKVYDVRGNEIATLVNEEQNPGNYNYQFSTVNYQLSSGVYFYKLGAGDFSETKRMILLK